jgi:monofunctional chorismate mutase
MLKVIFMKTIRGAITIEYNTEENIRINSMDLLKEIMDKNMLKHEDVESIIFTSTKDITKAYPAKFAREAGFTNSTLMCMQEMDVENSLQMCIRVLMFVNKHEFKYANHVYLKGAAVLRPDLIKAD